MIRVMKSQPFRRIRLHQINDWDPNWLIRKLKHCFLPCSWKSPSNLKPRIILYQSTAAFKLETGISIVVMRGTKTCLAFINIYLPKFYPPIKRQKTEKPNNDLKFLRQYGEQIPVRIAKRKKQLPTLPHLKPSNMDP
jgi:hypothetical protein